METSLLSHEPHEVLSQLFVQFIILPHVAVGHASSQTEGLCGTVLCDSHQGQFYVIFQLCSRGVVEVYLRKAACLDYVWFVGEVIPDCTVIAAVPGCAIISLPLELLLLYSSKAFDLFLAGNLLIGEEDRTNIVYYMRSFLSRRKGFIGLAMRLIVITQSPTTLQQSQQRNEVPRDRNTIFLPIFSHYPLCLFEGDNLLSCLEVV
jgi:hypothetical protein